MQLFALPERMQLIRLCHKAGSMPLRSRLQCFDAFGNARVLTPSITISLTMGGLALSTFSLSTSGNTRTYTASVPSSWFSATSESGATAELTTQLNGLHSQHSTLQVLCVCARTCTCTCACAFTGRVHVHVRVRVLVRVRVRVRVGACA